MKQLQIVVLLICLVACSPSDGEIYNTAKTAEKEQNVQLQFESYKIIVNEFPNSQYHAEALFQLGFISNNYTKNFEDAKKYYREFIKKYPQHELADDAEVELQYIGVPIDNLPFLNGSIATESEQKEDVQAK